MKKELIEVNIEIEDYLLLQLCLMAHKRNMTLNDFIVFILKEQMKNENN